MTRIARYWKTFRAMPEIVQMAVILAVLVVIGMLVPEPARADSIAHQGADWVRLTLKPCDDPAVVEVMTKQGADPAGFRAGSAHVGGQDYALCWAPVNGGAGLVFADGDAGFVPASHFKPAPEA